ncbi:MAG: response regulator [Candidatus Zixiibacteriota bacterium]
MSTRDTILVYDSDTDILDLLEEYFRRFEYDIITVDTKQGALEQIRDRNISVLLFGVRATETNELALIREAGLYCGDMKTIVLCAFPTIDSLLGALRAGVFDVIIKPFRLEQLESAVKRAIAAPRYKRELSDLQETITVLRNKLDNKTAPRIDDLQDSDTECIQSSCFDN